MKALLINPPAFLDEINFNGNTYYPPLGICYIASVLEKNKIDVSILDAYSLRLNEEQFKNEICKINPDIVGFTSYLVNYKSMLEAINITKNINKKIKIVVGGPNTSVFKEKIFEDSKDVDFIIVGEGEYSFLELINALQNNTSLQNIKGLIYREEDKIINNGIREWIQNLDEIPFPAWHLLPNIADKKIYCSSFRYKQLPLTVLSTSRGCPYNCLFCDRVFGKQYRTFSAERVVEEMIFLKSTYGIKEFTIFDDNFISDVNRVKKICNLLIEKDLKISWSCLGRVDIIQKYKEIIPLMKEAGCWYISFGLESGNQKVLDYIRKNITINQIKEVISMVHKSGMMIKGYFMIGHPIDTKETIEETIKFAKSLPIDTVQFSLVIPYPNTELYEIAKIKGTLNQVDYEKMLPRSGYPIYIPEGLTAEYLSQIQKKAYKEFYFRPKYIFGQLKNITNFTVLKKYISNGFYYLKTLLLS